MLRLAELLTRLWADYEMYRAARRLTKSINRRLNHQ